MEGTELKRVSLDTWIQLLGCWGSWWISFVGLEMRQSQRIAIGAQQQARAELRAQELLTPFQKHRCGKSPVSGMGGND